MLKEINKGLEKGLYWATAATCALFLIVVLLAVLARYLFKSPVLGSIELSRIFFLWSCFTGAALCYRQRAHIAITFLTDRLPPQRFRLLTILLYSAQLPFFLLLGYSSLRVVYMLFPTKLPLLNTTQALLYLPVPVCLTCLVLFCIEYLTDSLSSKPTTG